MHRTVARRLPLPPAYLAPHTPHALLSDSPQSATAFNQPLSFDASSVTNMDGMFYDYVRSRSCPPPNLQSSPLPRTDAACTAVASPPARSSPNIVRPSFDSAGRKLPVRCQQAAHPLRVGGNLDLRLRWL